MFSPDHIQVWRLRLDEVRAESESAVLSPDEVARASRFHFEKDRKRFVHCRSALRRLLGQYIWLSPQEIQFDYQSSGKPELTTAQNPNGLCFNVSHSSSFALIAISAGCRVGVDIEQIRPDVEIESLAERFFSARERSGLQALPEDLRRPAFFACWTRKEAFQKATGQGLSFPLSEFSVNIHPYLNAQLEEIRRDQEAGKQWFLRDLEPADGYRATVAADRVSSVVFTYSYLTDERAVGN